MVGFKPFPPERSNVKYHKDRDGTDRLVQDCRALCFTKGLSSCGRIVSSFIIYVSNFLPVNLFLSIYGRKNENIDLPLRILQM